MGARQITKGTKNPIPNCAPVTAYEMTPPASLLASVPRRPGPKRAQKTQIDRRQPVLCAAMIWRNFGPVAVTEFAASPPLSRGGFGGVTAEGDLTNANRGHTL